MIRTIFAVLFAVVYLICGIPVLGIEWIIGKFNKEKMDVSSLRMVQWALGTIGKICGVKLTVIGKENIPKDQAVLYVCNHRSYFDIILGYSIMPGLTGYISKDDLEKVPLLNIWMRRLYCLFLNRTDMKQGLKTILKAIEYIKQGVSICIFPEGTRNRGEEGSLLENALSDSELFQGMEARLITVGLRAGSADEVMNRLAQRYRDSSLTVTGNLISIVEPTIVIIFSVLIGLVLLSVMMPLLGILSDIAI